MDIGIEDRLEKASELVLKNSSFPDKIFPFKKRTDSFQQDIKNFMKKTFRWIHIDAGHTGQDVLNDLEIAELLLNRHGIICMEDFLMSAIRKLRKHTLSII